MNIPASYIANLLEYASQIGVGQSVLRKCLKEESIDLCQTECYVSAEEFLDVFQTLQHLSKQKDLGLNYGCYLNLKALGLIAQISLSASSIQQALIILQDYLKNMFPLVSICAGFQEKEYKIIIESNVANPLLRQQISDMVFCLVYRELRLMLPNEIGLVSTLPYADRDQCNTLLGTAIEFGEEYAFAFDRQIIATEINPKRLKEIENLLPVFLQLLENHQENQECFSNQVKAIVLNLCSPELPTFEQVASHFALSDRSFQRKLSQESTSFRQIADELKWRLHQYLSAGRSMKTQDIAYVLGYSTASAYVHAVRLCGNV